MNRVTLGDQYGTWPCAVRFEDKPLTVSHICRLPGTIPEAKLNWMSLSLHDFNRSVRFGRFTLHSEKRTIFFRYTYRIMPVIPLHLQFDEAMRTIHYEMKTLGRLIIMVMEKTSKQIESAALDFEI